MHLRVLLPFGVFALADEVSNIVAETREGSFGLLPRRLDCVAALVPGILAYTTASGTVYLAADEGVLIKRGAEVTVSVRHCIRAATLAELHDAVKQQFLNLNVQDQAIRRAITRMEGGLVGRLAEFQHER
jgi:F-type H+-transporting ATPase subunit epsilon